jgi:hypothetical protein
MKRWVENWEAKNAPIYGRLKLRWEHEKTIRPMLEAIQTGLCFAAGCGSRNAESSAGSNR